MHSLIYLLRQSALIAVISLINIIVVDEGSESIIEKKNTLKLLSRPRNTFSLRINQYQKNNKVY